MAKINVVAQKPGFFGHLREIGEKFVVECEEDLGDWMRRSDADGNVKLTKEEKSGAAPMPAAPFPVATQHYTVKHKPVGNFIVVDADGNQVGEEFKMDKANKTKAKLAAQAEADSLNSGVPTKALSPVQAATVTQTALSTDPALNVPAEDDDEHPDA